MDALLRFIKRYWFVLLILVIVFSLIFVDLILNFGSDIIKNISSYVVDYVIGFIKEVWCMLSKVEKSELVFSALSSDAGSASLVEIYKRRYEMMRDFILNEGIEDMKSLDLMYETLRDADNIYTEYIKALESRVSFLESLAVELSNGVAERNAEFVKGLRV